MSSAATHEPITPIRHAEMMAEILRYPSRAWSALNAPGDYVYDERDHLVGTDLDTQCDDLRLAFLSVTDWRTAMKQLRRLIHLDNRRRRMSVGVSIDGQVIWGEAL